ncbi:hypothetical protein [uncultured Ruegeria sp.]|uniref:hypothetical protein n=1 Tax=uncultured Ruegeria sp. TaxID=259304 RepID=UPI00260394F5|nr:hypothetical protein [uncultured Ruegeria sp.]
MPVNPDGLTGEILPPASEKTIPAVLLCEGCGRLVVNETVWVTEDGELWCGGCKDLDDTI